MFFPRYLSYLIMIVVSITAFSIIISIFIAACLILNKYLKKGRAKSSDGKTTNNTPVSLLEVKVTLPTSVIFSEEGATKEYDPTEMAQLPKVRLGEGVLGTLFKVVLNSGSIVTIRKIREELLVNNSKDFEFWINFFGGVRDVWLLPIHCSFWYGGEAFVLYEYLCLGSLEELLHGSEGIQFTALSWGARKHIALSAGKAVAFIHSRVTKNGEALICGVIKTSNILIRLDCSACLSGYETPYLVPPATIIRRNSGRVAPELASTCNYKPVFTQKSDVYSFGVLLLELITGKRPALMNLREFIKEKRKKEGLKGICDKRMGDVKEGMNGMIGIAQSCLLHNPNERPSMDGVVQMIHGLQE